MTKQFSIIAITALVLFIFMKQMPSSTEQKNNNTAALEIVKKEIVHHFIRDGKLMPGASIVGRSTRVGDGKDDKAFLLHGLYKFVYAGAGFRSPNAHVHARISLDRIGRTGAGVNVNGHWFTVDMDPNNKIGVAGPKFGNNNKDNVNKFLEAKGRIEANKAFDMDIYIKDGLMTYFVNGEKMSEVEDFPTAMQRGPLPEVSAVQKLGLVASIRSWQAKIKIYEFSVKSDGEFVAQPDKENIFKSGTNNTRTYRIPALLVSKKGSLLAFAEARRNTGSDTGNIDIVLRRSEDGAKTWGKEIVVFDLKNDVAGNPCPVVDQSTGRIWLLTTWNSHKVHENQIQAGFGNNSRRVFSMYSDDDGKTWSKAKEITKSAKLKDWSWYATGPGAGIQLERGAHKGRLIIPCDHSRLIKGKPKTHHSHILYSDDHGETWKIGAQTQHGLNECEAVELENGDLMLNSRNHGVNEHHRGVSISKDGGETFSSFRRDPTLVEPRCQASIRRYRWAKGNKPGILLFSNPARKWREFLMMRVSYDDGKTWPEAKMVFPYTCAYSDIAVLPDGRIAILFERDNATKIDLAIFPAIE